MRKELNTDLDKFLFFFRAMKKHYLIKIRGLSSNLSICVIKSQQVTHYIVNNSKFICTHMKDIV